MGAVNTYVSVPLEDSTSVAHFFKVHGCGAGNRGFQMTFIAKETGLPPQRAMAAICALIEAGEVELNAGFGGWNWIFKPKAAA